MNLWLRYSLVVILLLGASAIVHRRGQTENLPPHETLTSFPLRLGDWQGSELPLSPDVREVLGDGEFLQRTYFRASAEPTIDLFLA